ncbi:hypothetical protein AVEN_41402-1 [Araneus ventricosus]|uniref:DDE-1 domain-containing protein n=1 Tax=Araneus ventricosus TaxID=182803 RepID=A0A4Y2LWY8_ARAVE|nr:hypothetical protein AVEN_41402-1 [Araneus ventricosus]
MTKVQKPRKIISRKCAKLVGAVTSVARGTLATKALAVIANGNSVPSSFVFPNNTFKRHFLSNSPQGSAGSANKSEWMAGQEFQSFMKHFIKPARVTKEKPVILLLDHHQSHFELPTSKEHFNESCQHR